jgi:peptidyl-prolyl cis-trans isomerase B (cyclophilin B)
VKPTLALLGLSLALSACPKDKTPEPAAGSASPAPVVQPVKGTQRVELSTTMGKIKLELDADKAPKTVATFLGYVRAGHYTGTLFHRVIRDFMIQGGGFDTSYNEKPAPNRVKNEADNGLSNKRGTVAMARTPDPDSAGAQFFINVVDNSNLDHREKTPQGWGYCVFGKVLEGMDVVDKIREVATGSKGPFSTDAPLTEVVINEATIAK